MAVVWQNTLDGTTGNITVANSANYGDALSGVQTPAVYQTATRNHGAGAAYVGNTSAWGEIRAPFEIPQNGPYAIRVYARLAFNGALAIAFGDSTVSPSPLVLAGRAAVSGSTIPSRIFGTTIPTATVNNMEDRWIRIEIMRPGTGGTNTITRIWWDNPEAPADSTPDFEHTFTPLGPAISTIYFRGKRFGSSGVQDAAQGAHFDSIALSDTAEFIGPYQGESGIRWQNTFDGPDGTPVTIANSSDYGDAIAEPLGAQQTYSSTWTANGEGSLQLGASGGTNVGLVTIPVSPVTSEWSFRTYINVPSGTWLQFMAYQGTSLVGYLFQIDSEFDSFEIMGEDVSAYSEFLVDRPVRIEVRRTGVSTRRGLVRVWWTNIHDREDPDLELDTSLVPTGWGAVSSIRMNGDSGSVYADEVVVGNGEWIGPVDTGVHLEAQIGFTGTVEGTADVSGIVIGSMAHDGEVAGEKTSSVELEAAIGYTADVEYYATESGVANARFAVSGEVTHEAQHLVQLEQEIGYSADLETTRSTGGVAEGEIGYIGTADGQFETTLPDTTRVGLRYRLVAYEPNGTVLGQIPLPLSFQMGVPLNDMPSLALEYVKYAPNAQFLNRYCEVAVEIGTLTQPNFVEYPGCRFLNLRNQSDPTDRTGVVRYTMPGYGWQLRKARVLESLDEEGERGFTSATLGRILHTLLSEAQARGWNPGMSWDFTPQRDSAGQPWDNVYTISFTAGQDLWSILDAFANQDACDWRIHRRTLQVYNQGVAMHRDRTDNVVLHLGRDITEAPKDWTAEELAARILVRGDEGNSVMLAQSDSQRPWGYWEDYITQSGVTDTGTLTTLGQWALGKSRQPLVQLTRSIVFPTTRYMPFRDYLPGDEITAPGGIEAPWSPAVQSPLRVRQITLSSVDSQGMEGALILNNRFIEANLRRDRLLNALSGGAGSNPGGGGGTPGEDTRTPRAPQGLVLATNTYINEIGEPRGQITATWQPVTEATNNTPIDIRSYEVYVRWAAHGETFALRTVVDHPDVTAYMSPFEPDEVYEVRVLAVARNQRRSGFSATQSILVLRDAEPPDAPSAPLVGSRLGVARITWDGLTEFGTPMPIDFDHVTVWISYTGAEDDWEIADTLYREGVSAIPGLEYDHEYSFRFTATDRSGNESEPSAIATLTVEQLVPGDITPGSIGYELLAEGAVRDDILADDAVRNRHIAAGQITGEKIRAYSIFADRIAVGNTRNLITDPKHLDPDFNDLRLSMADGTWSYQLVSDYEQEGPSVSRTDNPNGTYTYYWIQSSDAESINDINAGYQVSAEIGRAIGTAIVSVEGLTTGNVVVTFVGRQLNREGTLITESAVIAAVTRTSNGVFEVTSNNGAGINVASVSLIYGVRVTFNGANEGARVTVVRPFSATSDGQVLIENGAVSANKIAANAVTADKIQAGAIEAVHIQADAITTDKLAANAITAKHTITGATIQTTATANRGLKITNTGLRGYDSNGNETFVYSSATGNVSITGVFQTGLTGSNRVVISSTATWASNPGVRLISGGAGARDSSLFITRPGDGSGFGDYSVVLTGSEVTRNSSGRTDLVMRHGNGGGGYLRYQWGTYGSIGVEFQNWSMYVRGRMAGTHGSRDMLVWGQSDTYTGQGGITPWTFTYGSSVPNGDRLVMLTGYTNNVSNQIVNCSVVTQNRGNFVASAQTSGTYRLQYLSTWVDRNV
jgi:hypothetical protein